MHAKHADGLVAFDRPPETRSIARRGLPKSSRGRNCRLSFLDNWRVAFANTISRALSRNPSSCAFSTANPQPITSPERSFSLSLIRVFRVHHLVSALKFSFLIPPADGCSRVVIVPNVQRVPSAGLEPGASGQDLCADVLVHPTGTLHSLGPVPWAKLEPADPDHRSRVGDSGGAY